MNNRRFWALLLSVSMLFSLLCFEGASSVSAAEKQEGAIIDLSTVWKYLDDGSDPSDGTDRTSWTTASFNDGKWKSSKGYTAKFGAQAGKLATFSDGTKIEVLLNQYKSNGENIPTYFFRTEFTLDELPASGTSVVGTVSYDDALIVYINGTKVASYYEPSGGFATNLSYGGSGLGTPLTDSFTFDSSLLKKGKNIVKRHNSARYYLVMYSERIFKHKRYYSIVKLPKRTYRHKSNTYYYRSFSIEFHF